MDNNSNITMRTLGLLGCVLAGVAAIGCGRPPDLGPVADASTAMEIRKAITGASGEASGGTTAAPTGTGWAVLRGRFTYEGNPPTMPPYDVTRDFATCRPGGIAPRQQTLVVNDTNQGIKNIAVYLRNASRVHESAQAEAESVVFDQKTCLFLSHVMPMTLGQSIEIKNSDNIGHNTKIEGKSNKFNQTIAEHQSVMYKPQREEAVPAHVACSIHPWMSAYILPRKDSYYSISAEDGTFEIANLPAGEELEFQVWHESATGPSGALVPGTQQSKELKWSTKGRFKVTLKPDEVREIDLVVPASAFSI